MNENIQCIAYDCYGDVIEVFNFDSEDEASRYFHSWNGLYPIWTLVVKGSVVKFSGDISLLQPKNIF